MALFRSLRLGLSAVLVLVVVAGARAQRTAEEELKTLRAAPEFEVSLFAAEPQLTNPAAIDVDTQGRVWVAEIEWYRAAVKDPPADKIRVLEDTDGDGRADKSTVFAEGLFCPMSICVAGDKVFVATSPDLWVYEDKNGDLRADGPPKKLLTGFGGRNHDHGAHSLVLGPDHRWWMSHGDEGIDVQGTDGSRLKYPWGSVVRGELDGSKLEHVAFNFRNPYEPCVSSFGEAFLSDNDNDGNFSARICWILEGGNYGWFGGPPARVAKGTPFGEHWHFRGHIPGFVPATLVTGFGSPCGICYYEGDAFGPKYKNVALHADAGPREVRAYRHEPSGAGMKATSEVILTSKEDAYFRPDDVCAGPDGSLYVSDWYDGGVGGHAYNDPTRGRIFVLRPKGNRPERIGKPGPYSNANDALAGLRNPNLATQYLAREFLLKQGEASVDPLTALVAAGEPNDRARALWVLDRLGATARESVLAQLNDSDARMRALAVRILRRHGDEYAARILPLADDTDAEVRREVLLAIRKIPGDAADAALARLAAAYDGSDRYLLEAIHVAAEGRRPKLAAALAQDGRATLETIDLVRLLDPDAATKLLLAQLAKQPHDETMRAKLVAQLGRTESVDAALAVLKVASEPTSSPALRKQALALVDANLEQPWKSLAERAEFAQALAHLLAESDTQVAALNLIDRRNLSSFAPRVLEIAASDEALPIVRRKAFDVAAKLNAPGAADTMSASLGSHEAWLRDAAVKALVRLQAWQPLRAWLLTDAPTEARVAAVKTIVDNTSGAVAALRWIEDSSFDETLRQRAIAIAARHPDAKVRLLYEKYIPEADRPKRLGAEIDAKQILALAADANRGRQIFFKSEAAGCKRCHRVQGFGATFGPDLSQIGKKYERAALLETILNPSKAIAPEYVPYLLQTSSGQILAGFLIEKTDQQVTLRDIQGNDVRVKADEVELLERQEKSLMPELVLQEVTAQDAADLLAFLLTLGGGEK